MDNVIAFLDIVYGVVGLLFVAGAGAMLLMFAFIQTTARLAIWLDVGKAYKQRGELAARVIKLERSLDILASGDEEEADPDEPMVKAIKLAEPKKLGLGPPQ